MKITPKQYATVLLESLEGKDEKQAGETIKKFSAVLLANNHLSKLDGIVESFKALWDKKYNEAEAEIITANPVGPELLVELEKFIKARAGSDKVDLKRSVDKKILGGVVLRYGNKSLDLSLKNKLAKLKENLVN
jgi:ATP synthase F1 delta subunit